MKNLKYLVVVAVLLSMMASCVVEHRGPGHYRGRGHHHHPPHHHHHGGGRHH
ncbi:hypothetical protein [uncultured Chitinophaga sp.]|jgi:hypothetical protein|uniref:hypothetical protein n=1 Tax=uncultured Chitinophaga sp. TaxID=339340 RepID=UPI00262035B0|nr:hypothetical protein [uncultured Chitinophaga sp.]